jgi:hypothetical protein
MPIIIIATNKSKHARVFYGFIKNYSIIYLICLNTVLIKLRLILIKLR